MSMPRYYRLKFYQKAAAAAKHEADAHRRLATLFNARQRLGNAT